MYNKRTLKAVEKRVREILELLNYNLDDPNLRDTPTRVARTLIEELAFKQADPHLFTTFPEEHNQLVLLRGHTTRSRCIHHLERITYNVSIGYIPDGRVLGLSKLARIADYFAHGLTLQETYTDTLADALWNTLKPKGLIIYVVGVHDCMRARGAKSTGDVITHASRGDADLNEFLTLLGGGK